MILLDTHIWVWWANGSKQLSAGQASLIEQHRGQGLGVSVISCREVCKLVEKQRLRLSIDLAQWVSAATTLAGISVLPLTPQIAIESVSLPSPFHADPADQLLVATARVMHISLLTADRRLIEYAGVVTL